MAMGAIALGTGAVARQDRGHLGGGAMVHEDLMKQRHQFGKADAGRSLLMDL